MAVLAVIGSVDSGRFEEQVIESLDMVEVEARAQFAIRDTALEIFTDRRSS
ncbi:hypothetical protein OH805_37405 [Streptomyces sp. NBC_00879]|uniref:hypothetical protein n=1 Tax=Streptomyces sp. NBC_00879 TaxID=2975855 RepID=UPI00386AC058|nr:hypothetical protein OH805_37405 [Streptomyces sp. NBC_00879]